MRLPTVSRKTARWLGLGGAALALATAASLIGSLRHVLRRDQRSERERIRAALSDITVTVGPDDFAWLPPRPPDFDREKFLASLPVLDPPLSQTIIDMRDEEA